MKVWHTLTEGMASMRNSIHPSNPPNADARLTFAPGASVRGFTLIELLIVVTIIAILIAMLLPSLQKAKSAAKRAACASRLHHVGIAMHLYTNDYRGRMPYRDPGIQYLFFTTDNPGNKPDGLALLLVREYLPREEYPPPTPNPWWEHGQQLLSCPDARFYNKPTLYSHYSYRYVDYPSDNAMTYVDQWPVGNQRTAWVACTQKTYYDDDVFGVRISHNLDGVNVLFYDGSVKWLADKGNKWNQYLATWFWAGALDGDPGLCDKGYGR